MSDIPSDIPAKIDLFSECMKIRMAQNTDKEGWSQLDFYFFTIKMQKKINRMMSCIHENNWKDLPVHATDMANWAWMLVDNLGILDRFETQLQEAKLGEDPTDEDPAT